jgi:hypothetical protein
MTITIESQGDGVKTHTEGKTADGGSISYGYTAKYDGKDNPVTGSGMPNGGDTVALKRINANTTETTWKKNGKVVTITHSTVSKDGKTRTIEAKGTAPDGKPTTVHAVYEKQ